MHGGKNMVQNTGEQNNRFEHSGEDIFRFIMELIPSTGDLHALFDKIYNRYGLPIILTDISYHLIAYSGPIPCPDEYWHAIVKNGIAEPETIINGYYKDGYMDRISESPEPFDVNWGISAGLRQTTCAVRINGSLEGICSVLYIDEEKRDFALALNSALRTAAEIYIRTNIGKSIESFAPERSITARMLLEDIGVSVKLISNTTIYKQGALSPGYVVMALQVRDTSSGRLQSLRSSIKGRYPSMLYVNKDDGVYMFFSGIRSNTYLVDQILESISADAKGRVDYVLGISNIFHSLEERADYIEQARLALKYGMSRSGERSAYKFFDSYPGIVLQNGFGAISPKNLVLPEINALIEADTENASNFYESFKCYLYMKCDMSKTAAVLYMHRNSLMYRIKRCLEIMDVDIADQDTFERLYLCCKILDFKKNEQKLQ